MSLVTWTQTFRDQWAPLTNAAVSVYLSGTTTAACVFNEASEPVETAPQYVTDQNGYIAIRWDDSDYPDDQTFDIVCEPDESFNPTSEDIYLTSVSPVKSTGTIRDGYLEWDANSGLFRWDESIRLQYFGSSNLAFYPETDVDGTFEIGVSTNAFDIIHLRSKTWTRFYTDDGATYLSLEAGGLYSCHALTVIGCSPGMAMLDDADIDDAVAKVTKIRDEEGKDEIGEHGYQQLAVSSLPDHITNKHKLYQDLRKENGDLINWEDYCVMWSEGEFDKWRGGAMGIDSFTLSIVLKQDKKIKQLEAQLNALIGTKDPQEGGEIK